MTERIRSRIQAAEMRCLRSIIGVTRMDRVRNTIIREELQVEQLLLRIEKSQLRWFGHVTRMSLDRIPKQAMLQQPTGRRLRGRPRTRWMDQIRKLCHGRLNVLPHQLESMTEDRES